MFSAARLRRYGTRLIWLLCGCLPVLLSADGEPVRFVTPRHLSTVIGPTKIVLELAVPGETKVRELEVRVDGVLVARMDRPPWEVDWDAGDGSKGHRLEAVLTLSDGTRHQAIARTSALRIDQVEKVALVNLYPIVRDRSGRYLTDLTRDAFRILEDGEPQQIERFSTEHKPLRIGIVLDTSLSMERDGKLAKAQEAALGFLDVLENGDEGMLVTFGDAVHVAQPITSDRQPLAEAIKAATALGGTALYDAIWRTSRALEAFDGRRVLVLLSDGRDEAANGLEPGSLHTLDEALNQALRSEVMIFSIGLGRRLYEKLDFERRRTQGEILERLADSTGGRALISPSAGQLRRSFRSVAEDLRNQYSIAYISTNPLRDGGWRRIRISLLGREGEVLVRKGYYAESSEESSDSKPAEASQ